MFLNTQIINQQFSNLYYGFQVFCNKYRENRQMLQGGLGHLENDFNAHNHLSLLLTKPNCLD
jgi:hypothetical protein